MPKSQPNILVLLTDQQRWDAVGYAGNDDIRTPHLDRLALDSVQFNNSFCAYPVCTPSRYSLLSGLAVHQHGGWSNRSTLAPGIATFPRLLRDAGYRTKAVGKMHFNPTYLDVGFSELQLAEQNGDGRFDDDYHRDLMEQGLVDRNDLIDQRGEFREQATDEYWATCGAQTSNLPEEWHSTTWVGEQALFTLDDWTDEGNLLMAGFVKPHHPFDPPAPWDAMYDPDELSLLPGWTPKPPEWDEQFQAGYFPHRALTEEKLRRVMAYYYATISQIDFQVGRIIERLKQRGLYDNTLILFTSDHGEYMGFHHMLLKSGPMYDPLVRVPLLIKFPDQEGAGRQSETLVSNIDLAPTILCQSGIKPPKEMAGLNLSGSGATRSMLFAESHDTHRYMMARSQTHKLLLSRDGKQNCFFDLQADPLELQNQWQNPAYAALKNDYQSALADWMMFDSLAPQYQDLNAPVVAGKDQGNQRERIRRYFEEQMSCAQSGI